MRDRFWERVPMDRMTPEEWEALCDGCGKCCLNKLEDEDTQDVALTRVACRLLDDQTCRCGQYEIRKTLVPECIRLTPQTMGDVAYFMPETCAYRLLHEGKPLYLVAPARLRRPRDGPRGGHQRARDHRAGMGGAPKRTGKTT
jgi:uncharacterized cysteine cluster protein YcgN (CxxCxxCC family)